MLLHSAILTPAPIYRGGTSDDGAGYENDKREELAAAVLQLTVAAE
jgi:hypothetical protein